VREELDLTALIHRAQAGDAAAAEVLFATTYQDLRRVAHARLLGNRRDALLDTTALVHEWFLRFSQTRGIQLEDRAHFMRYAARAMRSIIVDFVRERSALRRGGSVQVDREVELSLAPLPPQGPEEILAVHAALGELALLDERMASVVELRYFGGLSDQETAEALGVTDRTVRRDWEKARLWLAKALR
jgi:RNA polymerase sigma factor (TIGR02999 family)